MAYYQKWSNNNLKHVIEDNVSTLSESQVSSIISNASSETDDASDTTERHYWIVQSNTQRNFFQQYMSPLKFFSLVFIFGCLFIIILLIYHNVIQSYRFINFNNDIKYLPEYSAYHQEIESLCYMPLATGNCSKQLNRFYFNSKFKKCAKFIYT